MFANDCSVLEGMIRFNLRLILTDYRKSMQPYTFQCIMSLKLNRDLWGIQTLQDILKSNTNVDTVFNIE